MTKVIMEKVAFLEMLDRIVKELSNSDSTALRGAISPIYDSLLSAVTLSPPDDGEYLGLCGAVSALPAIIQAFAAVTFSGTNMAFVTTEGARELSDDERHSIAVACATIITILKPASAKDTQATYKTLNESTIMAHYAMGRRAGNE